MSVYFHVCALATSALPLAAGLPERAVAPNPSQWALLFGVATCSFWGQVCGGVGVGVGVGVAWRLADVDRTRVRAIRLRTDVVRTYGRARGCASGSGDWCRRRGGLPRVRGAHVREGHADADQCLAMFTGFWCHWSHVRQGVHCIRCFHKYSTLPRPYISLAVVVLWYPVPRLPAASRPAPSPFVHPQMLIGRSFQLLHAARASAINFTQVRQGAACIAVHAGMGVRRGRGLLPAPSTTLKFKRHYKLNAPCSLGLEPRGPFPAP